MWHRRVFWIGIILSLFLLVLFFRGTSVDKIWESILQANYFLVIPAILSYFIAVWWRAVRWRFLLSPLGNFASHRLLSPIAASFAINNLMPGRIGLFVVSGFLVGEREKISKIAGSATALMAQIFDSLVLLLIVIAISFTSPLSGWALQMSRVAIVFYSLLIFPFFFAAFNPGLMYRLGHFLSRPLPPLWQERARRWLDLALSGVAAVRSLPNFTIILITSLLIWTFEAGVFVLLALSFNINLPLHSLFIVTAIAYFSLLIPSLPGGVGPFEYFGKQTLIGLGVNQSLSVAFMSIVHLTLLLPVTLVGLVFLWLERHTLAGRVRHQSQ